MSSRPQFNPQQVFIAGNNSMAGSLVGLVTIIQKLSMISYGVSWTGTAPVGTFTIEVSNDYTTDASGAVANAGTWNTMPFQDTTGAIVTSIAITGASGKGFIDIDQHAGYAIRPKYTRTSGTGTLSTFINAKVA